MFRRTVSSVLLPGVVAPVLALALTADPWPLGVCARHEDVDDGRPICVLIDPSDA